MYSFARTPRWLAGHALAGGLLVIFLIAGFWQLSRHNEVRDRNAAIIERQDMRPLDVEEFLTALDAAVGASDAADAGAAAVDYGSGPLAELEYRPVSLSVAGVGWGDAVQIRNRSLRGVPGCHLALPMAADVSATASALDDDATDELRAANSGARIEGGARGVLVVAGWLPTGGVCEDAVDKGADAFRGGLSDLRHIEGRIRLSQQRGLLGPADPQQGRLDSLARTDVGRIDQQTSLDLVPVYIELTTAARADGTPIGVGDDAAGTSLTALLAPLAPPELDAGPHLGYTFQWFSFAAVAVVGYALVLRHQARKGESEQIADD